MEERLRILLADDEEIVHETIADYLTHLGYRVDGVQDGRGALQALEKEEYDIALVDVRMPGLNGLEVLEQVRELAPDLSVVIITGIPDEGALAAYRVLAKDFTRTVAMAVTTPSTDTLLMFQRAGAVTVSVGPEAPWAPAWRTAMELSWSTASAG